MYLNIFLTCETITAGLPESKDSLTLTLTFTLPYCQVYDFYLQVGCLEIGISPIFIKYILSSTCMSVLLLKREEK